MRTSIVCFYTNGIQFALITEGAMLSLYLDVTAEDPGKGGWNFK